MLHVISKIDKSIPIYFLDTGFHFPETLEFRNEVTELLGLNLINVVSPIPKSGQLSSKGQLMFAHDPDFCCHMNKTLPMEPVLQQFDIWISGLRRDQNANRKNLDKEAKGAHGTLRYHPMLDWTNEMIDLYMSSTVCQRIHLKRKATTV